jgi:hypothetical protein
MLLLLAVGGFVRGSYIDVDSEPGLKQGSVPRNASARPLAPLAPFFPYPKSTLLFSGVVLV